MIAASIRKITRRGTNKILSLIPISRETEGLPEEISFKQLDMLCVSLFNDHLKSVSHLHAHLRRFGVPAVSI